MNKFAFLQPNSKIMKTIQQEGKFLKQEDVEKFLQENVDGKFTFTPLSFIFFSDPSHNCDDYPLGLQDVIVVFNKDGKLLNLPKTLVISSSDAVVGNIVFAALEYIQKDECNKIIGLSDKQLELIPGIIDMIRYQ